MLIVLLDCSGSMNEPFSGEVAFSGRTRQVNAARKIDAARETLHHYLVGVAPGETISVIAFADRTVELFRGLARDAARWDADHADVGSGTDIPAALRAAITAVRSVPDYRFGRVVLISDGLQDGPLEELDTPVEWLAAHNTAVDVILIDPSARGLEIAARVAKHGAISGVESQQQLGDALGSTVSELAARAHAENAVDIALAQAREPRSMACRLSAGLDSTADSEDIAISVAYPPSVQRRVWNPLDVFVHLATLDDEVARIVRNERGTQASRSTAATRLTRGSVLRVEVRISDAEADIEVLHLRWLEDVQRISIRFRAAASAGPRLGGAIDIYFETALIATVPVSIIVVDADIAAQAATLTTRKMLQSIFVSYATEERGIVEKVTHPYRQLGIAVFMDKDFLHVGNSISEGLRTHIERADAFQLYWSARSSKKPWVEREWRHALTLAGDSGRKGRGFIRPITWEPAPPALPSELSALDVLYGRIEPSWLGPVSAPPSTPATPIPEACVVLETERGELEGARLRQLVADAASFLQSQTGRAYVPIATEIVGDHLVRHVGPTWQDDPGSSAAHDLGLAMIELVSPILMGHHVSGYLPPARRALRDELAGHVGIPFDVLARVLMDMEVLGAELQRLAAPAWLTLRDERAMTVPALCGAAQSAVVEHACELLIEQCNQRGLGKLWLSSMALDQARLFAPAEVSALESAARASSGSGRAVASVVRACLEAVKARNQPAIDALASLISSCFSRTDPARGTVAVVAEAETPWWTRIRDKWAHFQLCDSGGSLSDFIMSIGALSRRLFDAVLAILGPDAVATLDYPMSQLAWQKLATTLDAALRIQRRGSADNVYLAGDVAQLAAASDQAFANIAEFFQRDWHQRQPGRFRWTTYGVFLPDGLETTSQVVPGTARVLLCHEAITRRAQGNETAALAFAGCTLVHEHLHAAVWAARRQRARTEHVLEPQQRTEVDALEEAVAAFLELRHARATKDTALIADIEAYIASGTWPSWPYAAAAALDDHACHVDDTIGGRLFQLLVDDPLAAVSELGQIMSTTKGVIAAQPTR